MPRSPFRVVQPWGRDRARQATVISKHESAEAAFAAIDALADRMVRTGAPSNAVEFFVVDANGRMIPRPSIH